MLVVDVEIVIMCSNMIIFMLYFVMFGESNNQSSMFVLSPSL